MKVDLQAGDIVERQQYIHGRISDAVEYERTITFRGALTRISDPTRVIPTEPPRRNITKDETHAVPAGLEVEVIDGWVTLTKSAAT